MVDNILALALLSTSQPSWYSGEVTQGLEILWMMMKWLLKCWDNGHHTTNRSSGQWTLMGCCRVCRGYWVLSARVRLMKLPVAPELISTVTTDASPECVIWMGDYKIWGGTHWVGVRCGGGSFTMFVSRLCPVNVTDALSHDWEKVTVVLLMLDCF